VIRSLAALLLKEIEHHGPALVAGAGLALTTLTLAWADVLRDGKPTLMTAASGFVYYLVPLYVFFVVDRLVVNDRSAGTHAFLSGLPLSAGLRFAVQGALGAVAVSGLVVVALGLTALLATTREGLPQPWVLQLLWQFLVYGLAWLAMDHAIAHLGRFRVLTWVLVLSLALILDGDVLDVYDDVLWHGVLADPIDQTRADPPLGDLPVALGWTAFGLALGLGLATHRGGVVPERLFQRGTERGFGVQILLGLMVPTIASTLVDLSTRERDDAWSTLARTPVQSIDVRVAGARDSALWAVGRDAARDLATLTDRTGISDFPTVVLVGGPSVDDDPVRPARDDDRSLVLVVDVDHDHADLVRHVVYYTLLEYTDWLTGWNTDTDWLIRGTPGWLRPDPVLEARAAAGRAAIPHVPDWLRMELAVGEDVAEGVAWAAVDALPDEAVVELLKTVFAERVPRATLPAARRLRQRLDGDWVRRRTGVDLVARWRDALTRRSAEGPPPHDGFGLRVEARGHSLYAVWRAAPPPGAQIRWRRLDPMSLHPSPGDARGVIDLDPDDPMEVVLPLDPTVRAAVELAWPDETVQGLRTTGWGARW